MNRSDDVTLGYGDGAPVELRILRNAERNPWKDAGTPVELSCAARRHEKKFEPIEHQVFAYCSFGFEGANPCPYVDGQPTGYQMVSLCYVAGEKLKEAVRFGIADDDTASPRQMAAYVPFVFDGSIGYYGGWARPGITYDFKLKLDLHRKLVTVWVSGRGDDEWFPLAVDAPLPTEVEWIDSAVVDQLPGASGVSGLVVQGEPWPDGEEVRQLPECASGPGPAEAFRFQPMHSLWRDASRRVTIARRPNVDKGWCLGFPDVVQTSPHSLVCAYVDGPAHGCMGQWWIARSDDLGETWRDVGTMGSGPAALRIQKLRDDSLLIVEPSFFGSTDGGNTWERIGHMDAARAGGNGAGVLSRAVELDDGSWLIAGEYTPGEAWKQVDGGQVEVYRSTDRAKTWSLLSIAKPPYPLSIGEPSIVRLHDGRLVLFARENSGPMPGVKCFSSDNGKTWSPVEEFSFSVVGRTSAELLNDGRVMMTFRASMMMPALWAWVGDPDEKPRPMTTGVHINDKKSVGLKDGELHIWNDGARGQFTKYIYRPPDDEDTRMDVLVEAMALSNNGWAATVSIPFVGKLRIFPEHAELTCEPGVKVPVSAGEFHTYRVVAEGATATLYVDGKSVLTTDKADRRRAPLPWTVQHVSYHLLFFGNEDGGTGKGTFAWVPALSDTDTTEQTTEAPGAVILKHILPQSAGHSVWRRFEARFENPRTGSREVKWSSSSGEFPDQYQLDHIIEIEATITGADQGYSGWIQLHDGRVFVVNYSDDTARWNGQADTPEFRIPWVRGTWVLPEDLPKARA
jgi:hypothetical protein